MLNKNFKKFMSFVAAAFFVGSLPFTAFCSKGSKKISSKKKPFKNTRFSKVKIGDRINMFNPPFDKSYSKRFFQIENISRNSPFVLRIGKNFRISHIVADNLKSFMDYYGVIVFESGSVGPVWFVGVISKLGLIKDENDWKKEIFPISDSCENEEEKAFENGYKLVITNNHDNRKMIFNFKLGNIFSKNFKESYDFNWELSKYNDILSYVLYLNPVSSNGLLPKKILKHEIDNFSVSEEIRNIKEYSFCNASSLVSVNFLGKIELLGNLAFSRCISLKNVNFSDCVERVGDRAFNLCRYLNKIEFPQGLKSLGSCVFSNCMNLRYVILPDSLEEICVDTFFCAPIDVIIVYKNQMFCKSSFLNFFAANGGKVHQLKD